MYLYTRAQNRDRWFCFHLAESNGQYATVRLLQPKDRNGPLGCWPALHAVRGAAPARSRAVKKARGQ
jgi:hypothetical protein